MEGPEVQVVVVSLAGNDLIRGGIAPSTTVSKLCQQLEEAAGPGRTARILYKDRELDGEERLCRIGLEDGHVLQAMFMLEDERQDVTETNGLSIIGGMLDGDEERPWHEDVWPSDTGVMLLPRRRETNKMHEQMKAFVKSMVRGCDMTWMDPNGQLRGCTCAFDRNLKNCRIDIAH